MLVWFSLDLRFLGAEDFCIIEINVEIQNNDTK